MFQFITLHDMEELMAECNELREQVLQLRSDLQTLSIARRSCVEQLTALEESFMEKWRKLRRLELELAKEENRYLICKPFKQGDRRVADRRKPEVSKPLSATIAELTSEQKRALLDALAASLGMQLEPNGSETFSVSVEESP